MQKKAHGPCEDDPSKTDPTVGPEGETSGGTVDANIRRYLRDKTKAMSAQQKRENKARAAVPVKLTGTGFLRDRANLFKRDDKNPGADMHGIAAGDGF
jgi:hypothetical protein